MTYTATLTPSGDATYTVDVAAGGFTDAAGNANAVTQFAWTYVATITQYPYVPMTILAKLEHQKLHGGGWRHSQGLRGE